MTDQALDERSVAAWQRHLLHPVDPLALRAQLAEGTIPSAAAESARRVPDREAIRCGEVALTHAELDERARRLAAWVTEQGVRPGSRVLLAAPTSTAFVVAYLGSLHAGAAVTFADPLLTHAELGRLLEDARPKVAFAAGDRAEELEDLRRHDPSLTRIVEVVGDTVGGLDELTARNDPAPVTCADPNSVAHLAFTSGTTGRPKATPLTHANLLASIRSLMYAWRWTADDVLVHALPLTHGHGLSGLQAGLVAGCRGVFLPRFEPGALCGEIAAHGGTILFAVPAMWERLLAWDGFGAADLSSLRIATSGSAPLPPSTSDAVADVLGERPLERYGCTETGYTLSNPYEGPRRPGSVGFAVPGAEVRIVGAEGRDVEPGQDGEIVVRGPQVFAGYEGDDSDDVFLEGGWFRTGDIGQFDPDDGYVSITGRAKDVIISGGLNVYPREVELVLEQRLDVAAAAVVGVPSTRWGEEVVGFVVPARGQDIDREVVLREVRDGLAAYKCPKRLFVVEELPRNHVGKVLRAELRRAAGSSEGHGTDD